MNIEVAITIVAVCAFVLGWLTRGIEKKAQRDEALQQAQYLAFTRLELLHDTQAQLAVKDVIILDLFDHSEALNREIDALHARLPEGCAA